MSRQIHNGEEKIFRSRCREIAKNYSDILTHIMSEIERETSQPINEDTAFLVAKGYTRQQGIKEGCALLIRKINNYASYNE